MGWDDIQYKLNPAMSIAPPLGPNAANEHPAQKTCVNSISLLYCHYMSMHKSLINPGFDI